MHPDVVGSSIFGLGKMVSIKANIFSLVRWYIGHRYQLFPLESSCPNNHQISIVSMKWHQFPLCDINKNHMSHDNNPSIINISTQISYNTGFCTYILTFIYNWNNLS